MPKDVEELIALLARGADMHDEPGVDVLAHGLQCGRLLSTAHPGDPELAIAGLVHDIADITHPHAHERHDRLGAATVKPVLGSRIAHLVAMHVTAKRYLVATDGTYRSHLSARSIETLALQGEALTIREVRQLESDPDFEAIIALRRADEQAKVPGALVPGLSEWRSRITQLLAH
jgi:predicted HD phosphohydrolase